jgi:hypothetical protein
LPSACNDARHRGSENFIVDVVGYGEDTTGSGNLTALFWDRSPHVVDERLAVERPNPTGKARPTPQSPGVGRCARQAGG